MQNKTIEEIKDRIISWIDYNYIFSAIECGEIEELAAVFSGNYDREKTEKAFSDYVFGKVTDDFLDEEYDINDIKKAMPLVIERLSHCIAEAFYYSNQKGE